MKRLLIFLLLITGLIGTAQGTIPSYPNVKLTKLPIGTLHDSVVVTNGNAKVLKYLPVSQIKVPTNLDYWPTPTGGLLFSSTGNYVTLPLATTTNAGLLSPTDQEIINALQASLNNKVSLTGNETISGSKTFSNTPILSDGLQFSTNKSYNSSGSIFVFRKNDKLAILSNIGSGSGSATLSTAGFTEDRDYIFPNQSGTLALTSDVNLKVDKNTSITGSTNTKITYDSKGLVTSGTSLVAGDIPNISESQVTNLTSDLAAKQSALVSGTNIKTINGGSILGSGDVTTGDMTTTTAQNVSGVKTFLNGTFGFRNAANTFTSFFTNANTASWTYTLQNRNGTLLDNTDLSTINSSIAGKMANPSGTANYLSKFLTATTIGNSTIREINGKILINNAENYPNSGYDISLGFDNDKIISIEDSDNTIVGRDLKIKAGNTLNTAKSSGFVDLVSLPYSIGSNNCLSINRVSNNVYVSTAYNDIYKQIGGTGVFTSQGRPDNFITSISINTSNGDVFTIGSSIYKQTAGTGSFVAYTTTGLPTISASSWGGNGIFVDPLNSDVWVALRTGGIYKQTGGTGSFSLYTSGITFGDGAKIKLNPITKDIFVCDGGTNSSANKVYKQTASTGSFNQIYSGNNLEIEINYTNNDVYILTTTSVLKQTGGSGSFINQGGSISNSWITGMGIDSLGNVYAVNASTNKISKQTNYAAGIPDLKGGTLKLASGTAKGTGDSAINFYTSQKTTSGTDMQTETLRLKIDNEGHITATTMPVYADNTAALAGGLTAGKFYRTSTGSLMIVY